MQAKMCSLMMLDESRGWLDLRASCGAGEAYMNKPRLGVEESLLGGVVRRKKPVQVEDVRSSSRYQNVEVARREGLVSLLSVPLIFSGEAVGTLNIYTGARYAFSNEEIRILAALAELSAIAIEKARLYERVMDVEEQLRRNEKLSALGLLAAEVAHEIRNPLTVMKMLYHSLDLKFPAGDPRTEDARVMEEKIQHLNRIVERILDFARTAEPEFLPINLNELIEELGLLVRHKFSHQGIHLVRQLQSDLPLMMGDATQLEQAFLNLMLNAAEAMPEGGMMTVRSYAVGQSPGEGNRAGVVIEFEDTGTGMTEEQRSRAFNSLLATTKEKGTGLGLAIVGRIVEAHRGSANILPGSPGGTRIVLTLPLN
jgi:signal transduction histidine kinase